MSKFARYIRIYVTAAAVMVVKEGTEEATVATEEEVTAEEVAAEEVMAAMEGTEVEVTGEEERDPDPGRGADRARAPLG